MEALPARLPRPAVQFERNPDTMTPLNIFGYGMAGVVLGIILATLSFSRNSRSDRW